MGQSRILKLTELAPGQTNAFTVVNDTVAALEASTNESLTITTAVDLTMVAPDVLAYAVYTFTGATSAITIKFPELVLTDKLRRIIFCKNNNATPLTVRSATTDTSSVVLAGGDVRAIMFDGKVVTALTPPLNTTAAAGVPHSIGLFVAGIPATNVEVLRYVFVEPVVLPVNLVGSKISMLINPSSQSRLTLYKNGTLFGSMDISSTGLMTITAPTTTFIAGDVLTVRYLKIQSAALLFGGTPYTRNSISAGSKPDAYVISDGLNTVGFVYDTTLNTQGYTITATASLAIDNLKASVLASAIGPNLEITNIDGANCRAINARPQGGGFIYKVPVGYVKMVVGSVSTDSVTISDGTTTVTFTQPQWVDITPAARATNLKNLILASALKVRVLMQASNELCILNYNSPSLGTITRSAATAGDIIVESFQTSPNTTRTNLVSGFVQDTTLENLSATLYGTR
jgi:hypothetical protein